MYYPLNSWKTHLCKFDCESLFVSYLLPCHVYAKLKKGSYAYHLVMYLCIWASIQILYSWNYYLNSNACPVYETDMCALLDESDCSKYYMKVDSGVSPCVYRTNLCTYDNQTCIPPKQYGHIQLFIFPASLLAYMLLVNLHGTLRNEIKKTQNIQHECNDCLAITCCSTCGLAQEYREV
jgi:hypothetical protein